MNSIKYTEAIRLTYNVELLFDQQRTFTITEVDLTPVLNNLWRPQVYTTQLSSHECLLNFKSK
jgi:hypothetical protein